MAFLPSVHLSPPIIGKSTPDHSISFTDEVLSLAKDTFVILTLNGVNLCRSYMMGMGIGWWWAQLEQRMVKSMYTTACIHRLGRTKKNRLLQFQDWAAYHGCANAGRWQWLQAICNCICDCDCKWHSTWKDETAFVRVVAQWETTNVPKTEGTEGCYSSQSQRWHPSTLCVQNSRTTRHRWSSAASVKNGIMFPAFKYHRQHYRTRKLFGFVITVTSHQ